MECELTMRQIPAVAASGRCVPEGSAICSEK